jgi:multidrug efflux system membrane fusion protein
LQRLAAAMNRAFSNIRKRRVAIAVIGFLLGAAFLAFWLTQGRTSQHAVSTPAVPATVGTPTLRDLPIWLYGIGTVQPLSVVNIKVRVDGALVRVNFVEGQEVKPGDVLAQIDPRPFQAQLKQAQANLRKDQAQLANSQLELTRYTNLAELGAAPSQNVDTWKAEVSSLTAAVLADQAMVDTAALQLEFTTVTSPIAGRVGLRQVDPGSIVHTTDANGLVTIAQMHPIAVIFSLPQDAIGEHATWPMASWRSWITKWIRVRGKFASRLPLQTMTVLFGQANSSRPGYCCVPSATRSWCPPKP